MRLLWNQMFARFHTALVETRWKFEVPRHRDTEHGTVLISSHDSLVLG